MLSHPGGMAAVGIPDYRLPRDIIKGEYDQIKKLGIEMNYRTVDSSLYKRRIDTYDFDMVVTSYPASMSPGNELKSRFHSQAVNTIGIKYFKFCRKW